RQLRPDLRPLGDALEVRLPKQPRLRVEALLHQGHPAEGLDDADARRHLFDDRGEVALLVLHAPREDLVLVVELVAEVDDRQHADDDREGDDRLHEPDEPEAHEPAHRRNVGDCARQQLARLPVVVERHLQALEVRVEVVAQVGLHAQRRDAGEVPAHEDHRELEQPDHNQHRARLHELREVVMRDGPVDDVLDHLRDRSGHGETAQLSEAEDDHQAGVRAQVRQVPAQRYETHGSASLRASQFFEEVPSKRARRALNRRSRSSPIANSRSSSNRALPSTRISECDFAKRRASSVKSPSVTMSAPSARLRSATIASSRSGSVEIWFMPRSWQLTISRPRAAWVTSRSMTSASGPSGSKTSWPCRRKMSATRDR